MISTFFLELLPQFTIGERYLGHIIYLLFFGGFITIHLIEKIVYKQAHSEQEIKRDILQFESAGLAVHGFLIGIIMVTFFETYGVLTYIILIPFFVRAFGISVISEHIYEKLGNRIHLVVQFITPVIGAIVGFIYIDTKLHLYIIFATTLGFILYIIIRDMIPQGRAGEPLFFIIGALITLIISLFVPMESNMFCFQFP
ncbi:MAG: hypothetical protein ACTSR3_07885 [Candidatus Helarchaeota archaeon]